MTLKQGQHFFILLLSCFFLLSCGSGTSNVSSSPDFILQPSTQSLTVTPGGSTSLQVSITPLNGFSDSVSVTVSGVPAGVTISPATAFNVSPAAPQTVTLTASNSAALGNFVINFQATSVALHHSLNAALQVQTNQLASFNVTLNDSKLSFAQGGTASTIVGLSLSSAGNSNFTVNFSISGLPSGVQAIFGLNPFPFGQPAASLVFTASPNAAVANYAKVTVTATRTADGVQENAQLSINVTPPQGTLPSGRTDFIRMDGTPAAAVFDPVHNLIFASNPMWNRVDVISHSTHEIVNSIPAPSPTGMDMSLDGTQLIVATNVQQIISIDTISMQVVKRTNVPATVNGGARYGIPGLLANTSNGTALVGMTLNSSPPAYYLEQWNPANGTFTPRSVPGVTAWINQLVRTGDGAKALVVDYGTDVSMAVYDAANDNFSVSGQSPVGQVLGVAGSPNAHQFAIVGTNGLAFVDSNLNTLAKIPLGVLFSGMRYSPDGTKLYITAMPYVPPCGPFYPALLTFDTTTFSQIGVAPAFQNERGNPCPPYQLATPLAADNTGLIFSASSHGLVLDDAANQQNILNLPGGPPFPGISFTVEAGLNVPLTTGLGQIAYDVLPDVWFANTRGTNVQFSGGLISVTAPPSATAGLVNVKAVLPDGWFSLTTQAFSYGSQILFIGGNAGSPQGGASLALIGYGLIGNSGSPTVTIGGQPAKVTGASKYVDFNDSGFNASYPFYDVDEVMVVVPAGSPGVADITVTSNVGTTTLPKAFTYLPAVSDYPSADVFSFVLYDPQRHWVYLNAGNHIDVFSADTNQFLTPIIPPALSGTKQLRGLALTPDYSKLLVANRSDLSLAIINPDNPSASTAVQIVPSGLPNAPGPYAVAATSTGEALVTTGTCGGAPVYVLGLSTLQVTTPFNSSFICGGDSLWPTASGNYVLMGNALWSAATNQWTKELNLVGDSIAASGDGFWFASDYTRLDSQMIQHSQTQVPEFFSSLLSFTDWVGEKMNASGSLLYTPVPQGIATSESNGISVTDTNHSTWLGQILLTEQIQVPPVQSTMDFDETGNRLFLITNKGLTVVQLSAPPLSIGYLNPISGPVSGGTALKIRGSGFESGATVNFGGTTVPTTFVDASTLQAVTPPKSAGGTRVSIQNPDGSTYSLDAAFTYQ